MDLLAQIPLEAQSSLKAYVETYVDLGGHAIFRCEFKEAMRNFRTALRINPDHVRAHMGVAEVMLTMGKWREGFKEYECRTLWDMCPIAGYQCRRWKGETIPNGALVVQTEQGYGDNMQFARYLKMAAERVQTVYVCLPIQLLELFSCFEPPVIVPHPGYVMHNIAAWIPIMSLAHIFDCTVENVPPPVNFLPDVPLPEKSGRPPRVGLVWRTNRVDGPAAPIKNMSLEQMLPLAEVKGVEWVSLQLELTRDERKKFKKIFKGSFCEERMKTFRDSALVARELDLVITIDTAMAHLAGGVSREVWTILAFGADWRYLTEREDCVWYPNMRLFRCPGVRDWAGAVAKTKLALEEWVQAHKG
jgi:hypothetical protein